MLSTLRDIVDIARGGLLPDGDGANLSTILWAEGVCRKNGLVCPACNGSDYASDCEVCEGNGYGWFNINEA